MRAVSARLDDNFSSNEEVFVSIAQLAEVADELLGMTIATYIAGARGIFEFIRFDQTKPGILKKLGPISNDAVGGLVAGVSSNMCTRALSRR